MAGGNKFKCLAKVALRVFTIVASSASAERCWSIYGFIHSKTRNRLVQERANKMVFIYVNSALLDKEDENDYCEL